MNAKISKDLTIPCVYIPTVPSTLVNFCHAKGAILYGKISNLVTHEAISMLIVSPPPDKFMIMIHKIPLELHGQRVYASNLLSSDDISDNVHAMYKHIGGIILWHAHLGHLIFHALSTLYRSGKEILLLLISWCRYMLNGSSLAYDPGITLDIINVSGGYNDHIIDTTVSMIHIRSCGIQTGVSIEYTERAIMKCHFSRHLPCSICHCLYCIVYFYIHTCLQ